MVIASLRAVPDSSTDTPAPANPARLTWLWPALLTAVIGGYQLDRAPLWRDELATWSAATRPVADLARMAVQIDGVTAPYYLLMHGWIRLFGDSVPALRLPSLLSMVAAAALTTRLGERLFDTRTGLLAGLLFAVVPSTSRYGQEARGYALATLLALAATLLLLRAVNQPTPRRWFGYSSALAGLGLAHLTALLLIAGHATAVLMGWQRGTPRRLLPWVCALLPTVALLTPLAFLGRDQQLKQLAWVDPPTLGDLTALPGAVLQTAAVGGLLVGLALLGAAGRGRAGILLGLLILIPVALLFLGGLTTALWVPRYLVFLVPFGCLLAAAALAPSRLRAALPVVLVVCLLGAPAQADLRRTHEWPRSQPVDYRQAAAVISANQRPGDGIVFHPRDRWSFLDTGLAYYLDGSHPRDVLLAEDAVRRAQLWSTECPQPADCLRGVDRIWLLLRGKQEDPLRPLTGAKAAALRDNYQVVRIWPVSGLTVALLIRPG